MSDHYREVGYASCEIGGGRRPAVLVVDFQTAFTDPRYPLGGLPLIHAQTGVWIASLVMLTVGGGLGLFFWRKRYLARTGR